MKDNFSAQATGYAKYRPDYPDSLINLILSHVHHFNQAWDCGTGNGQTAKALAPHFKKVFATDISDKQLQEAFPAENIFYSKQAAESTSFESDFFDLITVSQALHWFSFDAFYREVIRVAKNDGFIAAWTYHLPLVNTAIDHLVHGELYHDITGAYWDAERKYVDDRYSSIPFPFNEVSIPVFYIERIWDADDLLGFLGTWSAVRKYKEVNNNDPVELIRDRLRSLWGSGKKEIRFPVYTRAGRVNK